MQVPYAAAASVQVPYAGGGKGGPPPVHPRPMGVCPLEPQNDAVALKNVKRGWLWYAERIVCDFVCLGIPEP